MDIKQDIDSFFSDLKREFGLDDDDAPPTPLEEATAAAERNEEGPPAPPITEVDEVEEEETYPGSRHLKKSVTESSEESDEDDPIWDDSPRTYAVKGKETKFYTISALATALRRKTVTMRKWEKKGYLPEARFRSPGAGKKQDRLYTRPQIEGLVAIAKEEGLMQPQKKMRIDQTKFPERAHRLFEALEQRSTK